MLKHDRDPTESEVQQTCQVASLSNNIRGWEIHSSRFPGEEAAWYITKTCGVQMARQSRIFHLWLLYPALLCGFTCASVLWCLEDTVFLISPILSGSYTLSPLLHRALREGFDKDIPFRIEYSKISAYCLVVVILDFFMVPAFITFFIYTIFICFSFLIFSFF